ncbi:MAG: hypothetical protein EBU08_12805, partial [Micrococcales bacterium]|nr:hypothetical protein [Micrococcales bacterium]
MFGFKNPQEAMAIMLLCQAEGLHPAIAMRDFHVIQGRPALKADAMLARFQQAGGSVVWKEYTNDAVTGLFTHPQGGSLEVTWTLVQAKAIGIASKDNWKNYPRAMLRARVISEGIRAVFPGCVVGVYTPEEVADFAPAQTVKHMGNVERVEDIHEVALAEVEEEGAFALYVPNSDQPYKRYATPEDWITGYADMVSRIISSEKFSMEEKTNKLERLSQSNQSVTEGFKTEHR